MSWLSKAKNKVKKWQPGKTQWKDAGKALKTVAPLIMGLTGVGLPFAAAAGAALSAVGEGKKANLGTLVKGGIGGAAAGATGGQLGGLMGIGKAAGGAAASAAGAGGAAASGAAGTVGTVASGVSKAGKVGNAWNTIKGVAGGLDGKEGFGVGDAIKIGGAIVGGKEIASNAKQSKKDSKYARALADEALANYREARTFAQDRWKEQSPLRDAFNYGAFKMSDSTNPFSRDLFSQFGPQAPGAGAAPIPPGPPGPQHPGLMGMIQGQAPQGMAPPQGPQGMMPPPGPGIMGQLQQMLQGGRVPGQPTSRSASVNSGGNAAAQDRGRDRMRDDIDEPRNF